MMTEHYPPQRAVLYARAAKDPDGRSVERQHELCREWAEEYGITVVGAFTDIGPASGKDRLAPGFQCMIECAASRAATLLVVTDLARISRHPLDSMALCQVLARLGIAIQLTTEDRALPSIVEDFDLAKYVATESTTPPARTVRRRSTQTAPTERKWRPRARRSLRGSS